MMKEQTKRGENVKEYRTKKLNGSRTIHANKTHANTTHANTTHANTTHANTTRRKKKSIGDMAFVELMEVFLKKINSLKRRTQFNKLERNGAFYELLIKYSSLEASLFQVVRLIPTISLSGNNSDNFLDLIKTPVRKALNNNGENSTSTESYLEDSNFMKNISYPPFSKRSHNLHTLMRCLHLLISYFLEKQKVNVYELYDLTYIDLINTLKQALMRQLSFIKDYESVLDKFILNKDKEEEVKEVVKEEVNKVPVELVVSV